MVGRDAEPRKSSRRTAKPPFVGSIPTGASMMLALRSIFFTLIIPGTVTVLLPYLILSRTGVGLPQVWTPLHLVGLVAMFLGASILLRCIWDFAAKGRGTLAPVDPPRHLVVQGLFRYVRNPMYLGALLLLLGQSLFFRSMPLLLYTVTWFLVVNLVVLFYEEPTLRRRFGESYDRYFDTVHRWLPSKPS